MKNLSSQSKKSLIYCFLSAALPSILLILSLYIIKASPFGTNTLLFRDANGQYLDFLSYTKTIISGENDLFYSFSKGMGGDLIGLAAYYMMSPFNLLFALSSNGNIHLMFSIVVFLKIIISGMLFFYTSSRLYGIRPELLVFSTAYALMGYNIAYIWNIMWLDAMMVLPLMVYGIYKIFRENKCIIYILSLSYAIFANYYTGFMLCISSVLICFAVMYTESGISIKEKAFSFVKYAFSSIIAGLSVSFIWIPALLSISSDRAAIETEQFKFSLNFKLSEFFSQLVPGAISSDKIFEGFPFIFCSTLVIFLVILFFFNKKIDKRKKIAAGSLLCIVFLSFLIEPINIIWHGFSAPNGFLYRYSFVFSYLLIFIAQYTFLKSENHSLSALTAAMLFLSAVFGLVYFCKYEHNTSAGIAISFLCLFIITSLFFCTGKIKKNIVSLLLCAVCIFEIGSNSILTLKRMVNDIGCMRTTSHYSITESSAPAIEYINSSDDSFFRTEKNFRRSHNDPMFFNYNGLTHFSSSDNAFVMQFLGKMGLRNNEIWAYFNKGTTNEAESLLGVKYIIGGRDITEYKNYDVYWQNEQTTVYKNNSSLPMAYFADKAVNELSMDNNDYFALHNDIWSSILGRQEQILSEEKDYTISLNNVKFSKDADSNSVYTVIDANLPASVCYEININKAQPLYYYFTAPLVQAANISINGVDDGQYFWLYRWDMSPAGIYSPGEKLNIELVLKGSKLIVSDEFFYYEDLDKLSQISDEIKAQDINIVRHKDRYLSGSFNADKDSVIVFSIPYNEGWTVKVDEEKADTKMVMDALLAIDAAPGEHSYELKYTPVGFNTALVVSAATILIAIVWLILEKRKK